MPKLAMWVCTSAACAVSMLMTTLVEASLVLDMKAQQDVTNVMHEVLKITPGEGTSCKQYADGWEVDVFYPETDGKYPVLGFGNGAGAAVADYEWLLEFVASKGYVVASPAGCNNPCVGDEWANEMTNAIEHLLSGEALKDKVDTEAKIGVFGHSSGGCAAMYLASDINKTNDLKIGAYVGLHPAWPTNRPPSDWPPTSLVPSVYWTLGTDTTFAPMETIKTMFEKCSPDVNAGYMVFDSDGKPQPLAAHNACQDEETPQAAYVADWFDCHLKFLDCVPFSDDTFCERDDFEEPDYCEMRLTPPVAPPTPPTPSPDVPAPPSPTPSPDVPAPPAPSPEEDSASGPRMGACLLALTPLGLVVS